MKKTSILILSCANFSDLWSNNLSLLEKFWPDHFEYQVISDGPGHFDLKIFQQLTIIEGSMSSRLIQSLENCDSKFVLLLFDDYFFKKRVKSQKIHEIIEYMNDHNIDYCRLFKRPRIVGNYHDTIRFKNIPLKRAYQVNFYPGIWKTESLLSLLKDGEDIWKTEVRLTRRAREKSLKCIVVPNNTILPFADIVRKGKYRISGKRFIIRNKLFLSNRETRTIKETLSLFFRTAASKILPDLLKEPLKKSMRKKGKIIYSDYESTDD